MNTFFRSLSIFVSLSVLVLLGGCARCSVGSNIYGADEFVIDSYQIQEGKFAILELQGYAPIAEESERIALGNLRQGTIQLAGQVEEHTIPVSGTICLFDLLAKARISKDANLFKSYISRNGCELPVDLHRLLEEGDMEHNISLQAGDKVYIARSDAASVVVLGEVGCPRTIALRNGFLPLRQALALAGGIPFTGDTSSIRVIRGDSCDPKIYLLEWDQILYLPETSLLLIPGDIVYVSSTPLTQWHRFLSQLLPSLFEVKAGPACSSGN